MADCSSTHVCIAFLFLLLMISAAHGAPPSFVVFGDSLVDVGNNNYLQSIAKSNFKFNGIDYPTHQPTGRSCNGRTILDFLSEHLGQEPLLPILDPLATGQNLLRGANFASAGSGILDETGFIFGERLTMNKQIQLYQEYIGNLTELVGAAETARRLALSPHFFVTGTNDILGNYELPFSRKNTRIPLATFENTVLSQFREQLKVVHQLGAGIIAVAGLGPLGCIPIAIARQSIISNGTSGGKCVDKYMQDAISFNLGLQAMLDGLRQELPNAQLVYYNVFDVVLDMINNPSKYGFQYTNTGCCGAGPFRGIIPCNPRAPLCDNRSLYVFWDPFHPTDTANEIIFKNLLKESPLLI